MRNGLPLSTRPTSAPPGAPGTGGEADLRPVAAPLGVARSAASGDHITSPVELKRSVSPRRTEKPEGTHCWLPGIVTLAPEVPTAAVEFDGFNAARIGP